MSYNNETSLFLEQEFPTRMRFAYNREKAGFFGSPTLG